MSSHREPLPNVDDLAAHPEHTSELAPDTARSLLAACSERILRLSQLRDSLMLLVMSSAAATRRDEDRFLDVCAVAAKLCKSKSWVQKNVDALPARRKIGGEGLWSERDIEAWMRSRPRWADN